MKRAVLPLIAGIALLYGCAEVNLPAISDSPTDEYRTGEFVWRDLITKDAAASAEFYSDVFGWNVAKAEGAVPDYYTIRNRGEKIGGILEFPEKSKVDGNEWLSTISSRDVAGASAIITAQGGQVMTEPQDVPGRGEYIIAVDPSGGIVALLNAEGGDPASSESRWSHAAPASDPDMRETRATRPSRVGDTHRTCNRCPTPVAGSPPQERLLAAVARGDVELVVYPRRGDAVERHREPTPRSIEHNTSHVRPTRDPARAVVHTRRPSMTRSGAGRLIERAELLGARASASRTRSVAAWRRCTATTS